MEPPGSRCGTGGRARRRGELPTPGWSAGRPHHQPVRETLRRVLDQVVERTGPADVVLVYFDPVHADAFAARPSLTLHAHGADWRAHRLVPSGPTA